jgi:hypothetical protein
MGSRSVWAQEGTPLAALNLPVLTVTTTEAGFELSPAEVAAGWTLVTFDNQIPRTTSTPPTSPWCRRR